MAKTNELDIPKAPIYRVSLSRVYEVCPNCKNENRLSIDAFAPITGNHYVVELKRCPDCGQLLDWNEEAIEKSTKYSRDYLEKAEGKNE